MQWPEARQAQVHGGACQRERLRVRSSTRGRRARGRPQKAHLEMERRASAERSAFCFRGPAAGSSCQPTTGSDPPLSKKSSMLVPEVPEVEEQESALSPCGCHPPPRFERIDPLLSDVADSVSSRFGARLPSTRRILLAPLPSYASPLELPVFPPSLPSVVLRSAADEAKNTVARQRRTGWPGGAAHARSTQAHRAGCSAEQSDGNEHTVVVGEFSFPRKLHEVLLCV